MLDKLGRWFCSSSESEDILNSNALNAVVACSLVVACLMSLCLLVVLVVDAYHGEFNFVGVRSIFAFPLWLLFWILVYVRGERLEKQDDEKRRQLRWYGKEVSHES